MNGGKSDLAAALVQLAIDQLPVLIEVLRQHFARQHPADPIPTDAEVMTAFNEAYAQSLAVDQAWLTGHPESPDSEK